jgi:hypothetical protein
MKIKNTSILSMILCITIFCESNTASAQYCSPSFSNGCFSWRNQAITLDAINWTIGANCSDFDFTTDTAYLDAGVPYPMSVTNGDWCGCGVWIDLNNDFAFDTTENLFHLYSPNATNNYNFNITVSGNVLTGVYRMRAIAAWGSDTYTVSTNGYGPCGSFQYGNFNDFTVNVTNLSTEIEKNNSGNVIVISVNPNPIIDEIKVSIPFMIGTAETKIFNSLGEKVIEKIFSAHEKIIVDARTLSGGIYFLTVTDKAGNKATAKFVKE